MAASIQKGKLKSFSAAPHCDGKTTLNIAVPEVGRIYLKLTYMLKKEIPLMEKKQVLGFDELKLDNQDSRNTMVARLLEKEQKAQESSWTKMIMSLQSQVMILHMLSVKRQVCLSR